ncbi:phage replisome organizer N-terminal domain-containing protein [Liquorilactobacillus mali]|uniref:phage replisome organizer N-terminal domain-containing protein n=1 Tax=Liquorilactobacillus mali TaxID=1618 RepID=UPI00264FB101|nr:phage replisome organizer N-terminal domain-containing protein [Liquorilactobacillus mali]MDN7145294.1 phage replisome organizer N-terminal domain-containing protein [Liquorilactobacillus mali]
MAEKIYYWIKLRMDFFKSPAVKLLRRMSGGDTYALIYLEMILLSLENNGFIYFTGIGKDMADEISLVLDEKKIDVEFLLSFLTNKKMIEFSDPNVFKFSEDVTEGLIGKEQSSAKRVRAWRKRQKALQSNSDVTTSNTELEKELDIEKEIDIDKDIKKETKKKVRHKHGHYGIVLLTDDQFEKLKNEFPNDWERWIERVDGYCQSTGKKYKDYLATIRNWSKKDKKKSNSFAGATDEKAYDDMPF